MRISLLGARGMLSFDDFRLSLERSLTVVVGPNGAGKSNLLRLIELCVRVIQCADRESTDLRQVLASFLMARRVGHASPGVEVRVGFELTDATEKALLVAFVRAAMVAGILENWTSDPADIDAWAIREVTEEKLAPLFQGEIVVNHRGTEDADWECAVEFRAIQDGPTHQWVLLGGWRDRVILSGSQPLQVSSIADRMFGENRPTNTPPSAPTRPFSLEDLLPQNGRVVDCPLDLKFPFPETHRRFAELAEIEVLAGGASNRRYSLARPLG